MTENEFLRQVLDLARLYKWRCAHFRPAMTARGAWVTRMDGESGYPDLTMTKSGRLLFVELKAGRGKPSTAQLDWIYCLRMVPGVEVYIWRPEDFETIIAILTANIARRITGWYMKVSELTRSAGYVRTTINLDEHQIKAAHKHNINVSMVLPPSVGFGDQGSPDQAAAELEDGAMSDPSRLRARWIRLERRIDNLNAQLAEDPDSHA